MCRLILHNYSAVGAEPFSSAPVLLLAQAAVAVCDGCE